jgi:hypothetical protein
VVAAALAAATVHRGHEHHTVLALVGALALAFLLLGLVTRWSAGLAAGVAVLGAQQALRLAVGSHPLDAWTPLTAGTLLLAAELSWWSIEPRVPSWSRPEEALKRLGVVVLTCVAATIASAAVVVAAGAPLRGGVGLELVGILAATTALALVALVAKTRSQPDSS